MKLVSAFALFPDLFLALWGGLPFLFSEVWADPWLLLHPKTLSRTFFHQVWIRFADGVDEGGKEVKNALLPQSYGVVLDIGSGFGHTLRYLDRTSVTTYIALEPNTLMHTRIREEAYKHNYHEDNGSLIILSCGAQETTAIMAALPKGGQVDTIVCVLTLCSVPNAEKALRGLVDAVLKPGGQLLFYEHVLSGRADVAWWQRLWAPMWAMTFEGCRMDQPTDNWIRNLETSQDNGEVVSPWQQGSTWGKPGEPEEHLFWHQAGRFVKRE